MCHFVTGSWSVNGCVRIVEKCRHPHVYGFRKGNTVATSMSLQGIKGEDAIVLEELTAAGMIHVKPNVVPSSNTVANQPYVQDVDLGEIKGATVMIATNFCGVAHCSCG